MTSPVRTTVPVSLPPNSKDRSYPIHIGPNLIAQTGELIAPILRQPRVHIVTDANVAKHYLADLESSLDKAGIAYASTIIPPGEQHKNFAQMGHILDELLDARIERKTTLIALGGGVVGDMTGFAAAIVLRGVDFIQIPTTLLSQVDSSVGGKTGIDTKQGKNLIGSFHQPRMVIADTNTLDTLPLRELKAGYAEVAKYGLIDRPEFWNWLQDNGLAVIGGNNFAPEAVIAARMHAISESCKAKADIVARDETESDVRALLNLGHTFGHAFEVLCGYGETLVHGEAVSIGMILAFQVSEAMGLCPKGVAQCIQDHLKHVGLKTSPLEIDKVFSVNDLWNAMQGDKKVSDGKITFVLAKGIGQSFLTKDVSPDQVCATLASSIEKR